MNCNCLGASQAAARRPRSAGARWRVWLAASLMLAGCSAQAQWLTQTNVLKPGWTAVYLYVDASSQTLDSLVGFNQGCPIDQIWLWKTLPGTAQYISSPATPLIGNSQWLYYYKPGLGLSSSFGALIANTAYVVHNSSSTNYTWTVQGQPVPPSYIWDNTGLNFIGFETPAVNPPTFQNFLAQAPALAGGVQVFQYTGGNFGAQNPAPVYSLYTTPVTRGQAFWVSDTNINNTYFGPFTITLPNATGLDFGQSVGQFTFHLYNTTTNTLTVSAQLLPSETPPAGQTNIVGVPPLLVEGALNSSNLTYAYLSLPVGATNSWTLAPSGQSGSDVAVVMGVNRFALTGTPGSLYAGILRFSDSLGFSQVDVPVSANTANNAGLWVGNASISQVGSYLKSYATNGDGSLMLNAVTNFIFTTNYTAFATTNLVITNNFITNITVNFYDVTNLTVNSYSNSLTVNITNGFVPATNLVINNYTFTNKVITTTVTNLYYTNGAVVWQTAISTNVSTGFSSGTNYVPGTNTIAVVPTNNTPVRVTNFAYITLTISNLVVTNGILMGPVTNGAVATQMLTNSFLSTNLAFDVMTATQQAVITATNFTTVTNYAATNVVVTILVGTNFIATNSALAVITNGPNEIVVNPLINFYSVLSQSQTFFDTNSFVISNNFTGATNFLGSTTNQLLAINIAGTNSQASTNYTVSGLALTTNAVYLITTNELVGAYSNYIVTAVNTNLGAVPVPFPLRLIVFNDGTNSSLLQRVYYGLNTDSNLVVSTTQASLDPAQLGSARRISSVNLPWTAANNPIPFSGTLALGGTLVTTFNEDYGDQAANPFLHTYHPDHNNLDLTQTPPKELPVGSQSYSISRTITLTVAPNTQDFLSLTKGNTSLAGVYQETITLTGLGGATRSFSTAGIFQLECVSTIATLTTQ